MPTYEDFANAVQTGIGAQPYEDGTIALVNLFVAEGSKAENNPDDTEEHEPGSTPFNSAGVQNFATFAEGVDAMIATLGNGLNDEVVNGLRQHLSAETITAAFCFNSSWKSAGDLYLKVLPRTRQDFAALKATPIAEPAPEVSTPSPTAPAPETETQKVETDATGDAGAVDNDANEAVADAKAGKVQAMRDELNQAKTHIANLETHLAELGDLIK